jgi:acyl-CoA thioesterase FadM
MAVDFTLEIPISFGHCDPAGIVYYPNYYRWFDRCFHTYLSETAGGHAEVCAQLGTIGLGIIDSGATFKSPALQNDMLFLEMTLGAASRKTLRIDYQGRINDRVAVEGYEVRGVFLKTPDGLRGGEIAPLLDILGK